MADAGKAERFNPGNYSCVGGNTKFYGAVLMRYRAEDFAPRVTWAATAPGWPLTYAEIEPWYQKAEALYRVRGALGHDPTEPEHSGPYPFPPVPDEPEIADLRKRLAAAGLHPAHLPLGVDLDRWLARAATPWDAFSRHDWRQAGRRERRACRGAEVPERLSCAPA